MLKEKLAEILDMHQKWLRGEDGGKRANLYGANLRGANLYGANLRRANLREADLREADLREADLYGANLREADLREADLREADLYGANLYGSDLYGSDLRGADLYGSDLRGANLRRADLREARIEEKIKNKFFPLGCPEEGSFIAWKTNGNEIIKLRVPEDAKRSSAYGRKCRCNKAEVMEIQNFNGSTSEKKYVPSGYDRDFIYELGKMVEVENFDEDRWNECSTGIHFFITRQEAVDYMI